MEDYDSFQCYVLFGNLVWCVYKYIVLCNSPGRKINPGSSEDIASFTLLPSSLADSPPCI